MELTQPSGGVYSVDNPKSIYEFCRDIARLHYENFPVGSILIPRKERKYFYAVYSFARIADDIADELYFDSPAGRIESLNNFAALLELPESQRIGNPIALAVRDTMRSKNIPVTPFRKLIDAFISDINFAQPRSFDDSLKYCEHSANPIGELVLRIFGEYNEQTRVYSDAICTGLQLVNFWQDISVDVPRGRIYIPEEICTKYNLNFSDFPNNIDRENFEKSLTEIYDFTENFFSIGKNLINYLSQKRLKLEIAFTIESGLRMFGKVRQIRTDVLHKRVKLEKSDFAAILLKVAKNYVF